MFPRAVIGRCRAERSRAFWLEGSDCPAIDFASFLRILRRRGFQPASNIADARWLFYGRRETAECAGFRFFSDVRPISRGEGGGDIPSPRHSIGL